MPRSEAFQYFCALNRNLFELEKIQFPVGRIFLPFPSEFFAFERSSGWGRIGRIVAVIRPPGSPARISLPTWPRYERSFWISARRAMDIRVWHRFLGEVKTVARYSEKYLQFQIARQDWIQSRIRKNGIIAPFWQEISLRMVTDELDLRSAMIAVGAGEAQSALGKVEELFHKDVGRFLSRFPGMSVWLGIGRWPMYSEYAPGSRPFEWVEVPRGRPLWLPALFSPEELKRPESLFTAMIASYPKLLFVMARQLRRVADALASESDELAAQLRRRSRNAQHRIQVE